MTEPEEFPRIDRRTALQWIVAASTSIPSFHLATAAEKAESVTGKGYGPDPDLMPAYKPGELWPLSFDTAQRSLAIVLCDLIVPADENSPSASSLGVHDFIDEWISSPYQEQVPDRNLILKGMERLNEEARTRGAADFVSLDEKEQTSICAEHAILAKNDPKGDGRFFLRLRDLVAGGYYTTPVGMQDLGYRGNIAMVSWDGPTPEALAHLGIDSQEA